MKEFYVVKNTVNNTVLIQIKKDYLVENNPDTILIDEFEHFKDDNENGVTESATSFAISYAIENGLEFLGEV